MPRQPHHSSNYGGARPNSGRPLATKSKLATKLMERAYEEGIHPFDYILSVVRDETVDRKTRLYAAHAAMPYCGVKLQAVELNVTNDLDNLSTTEKIALASSLRTQILEQSPDATLPKLEVVNGAVVDGEFSEVKAQNK
jgi:hypothetical protein